MNDALLFVYLVSITLMIATPGPVVAFVLNAAARGGFRQALLTTLGTNGASLMMIVAAALVIMGLLTIDHTLLSWISLAGCIFLGWMAIRGLREGLAVPAGASPGVSSALSGKVGKAGGATLILRGFLIGISNPKDIIFFAAFFPQFVGVTHQIRMSLVVLTAFWILCDFTILSGYATVMNTAAFRRRQRWISVLSSGFLLVVAVAGLLYTLVNGINRHAI